MPSFTDLMQRLTDYLAEHRDEIDKQNVSIVNALQSMAKAAPAADSLNDEPLIKARQQLAQNYDARFGGFGDAPKFPHPTNLEFMLRTWADSTDNDAPDTQAFDMTLSTLKAMARFVGEISAGKKGYVVIGGQKHGQWPAASALSQQAMRSLVDQVDVRAFLAVYLDVDEQPVHQRGRVGILE